MEPTPSLETFRAALLAAGVPPGPIQAAVSGGATSPTGLSAALLLSGAARAAQLEAAYARWGERAEAAGSVSARLGPYEVEELLGQGACGEVYRVRDPRTGARYAAKRLVDLGDAEERSRFAREAEVLAQLQHPHVVRIHAAELAGASPYFVLDLCPRGSLRERLERGPLEQAEARSVVSALARGLEAAHEVGVLHRDLKPDNVLFDDDGRAQLADFGLARFLTERHSRLTQTGVILGTPCYMAPEQVQDAKRADARSDVYGLGAILYHCLTGRAPFAARGSLIATLGAVLREPVTPPRELVPGVDPQLEAVCLRALEKDPARRFPSARALREALEGGAPRPLRARAWLALGGVLAAGAAGLALNLGAEAASSAAPGPKAPDVPRSLSAPVPPEATSVDSAAQLQRARDALNEGELTSAWAALGQIPWASSEVRLLGQELIERVSVAPEGAFDATAGDGGSRGSSRALAWECALSRRALLEAWEVRPHSPSSVALVERSWSLARQCLSWEGLGEGLELELRLLDLLDAISAALERLREERRRELWAREEPLPAPSGPRAREWRLCRAVFQGLERFDLTVAERRRAGAWIEPEAFALLAEAYAPAFALLEEYSLAELTALPFNLKLDCAWALRAERLEGAASLERYEALLTPHPGALSRLDASRWDQVARRVLQSLIAGGDPVTAPPVARALRIVRRGLEHASPEELLRVRELALDLQVCSGERVSTDALSTENAYMACAASALQRCRSDPSSASLEEAQRFLDDAEVRMRAKRAAEPGTDYPLWVARYHAALLAQDSTAAERWRARLPSPPPLLTFPCSWLPWYARYDRTRHRFACEPDDGRALIWQPEATGVR